MYKLKSCLFSLLILCATPLIAEKPPEYLDTKELAKITSIEFYYDQGFGEHEFEFSIVYPYREDESESSFSVWNKANFGEIMKWKVGDLIYIDRDNFKAYNLRTKNWGTFILSPASDFEFRR